MSVITSDAISNFLHILYNNNTIESICKNNDLDIQELMTQIIKFKKIFNVSIYINNPNLLLYESNISEHQYKMLCNHSIQVEHLFFIAIKFGYKFKFSTNKINVNKLSTLKDDNNNNILFYCFNCYDTYNVYFGIFQELLKILEVITNINNNNESCFVKNKHLSINNIIKNLEFKILNSNYINQEIISSFQYINMMLNIIKCNEVNLTSIIDEDSIRKQIQLNKTFPVKHISLLTEKEKSKFIEKLYADIIAHVNNIQYKNIELLANSINLIKKILEKDSTKILKFIAQSIKRKISVASIVEFIYSCKNKSLVIDMLLFICEYDIYTSIYSELYTINFDICQNINPVMMIVNKILTHKNEKYTNIMFYEILELYRLYFPINNIDSENFYKYIFNNSSTQTPYIFTLCTMYYEKTFEKYKEQILVKLKNIIYLSIIDKHINYTDILTTTFHIELSIAFLLNCKNLMTYYNLSKKIDKKSLKVTIECLNNIMNITIYSSEISKITIDCNIKFTIPINKYNNKYNNEYDKYINIDEINDCKLSDCDFDDDHNSD